MWKPFYNSKSYTSIKRLPNGSRGEETVKKKQQKHKVSHFYFYFYQKMEFRSCLFDTLSQLLSNELP